MMFSSTPQITAYVTAPRTSAAHLASDNRVLRAIAQQFETPFMNAGLTQTVATAIS